MEIHRIWSTDWFKNREKEIQRLISLVQQIINDESSKVYPLPLKQKKQDSILSKIKPEKSPDTNTLREELIQYRKANILPNFPDISNCILRDELLDRFVNYKPTTRDEFYKSVPMYLRQSTDGKQMQYLGDILEIVESYSS